MMIRGERQPQQSQPQQHQRYHGHHGDLINGLTNAAFLPLYLYKAWSEQSPTSGSGSNLGIASIENNGPLVVCGTFAVTAIASISSWWYTDVTCSWLAFGATLGSVAGIDLYQWPHDDEQLLRVQLIWQLVVCSANVSHTLVTKLVMGLLAAAMALLVSYASPLYTVSEMAPTIVLCTVVYTVLNVAVMTQSRIKAPPSSPSQRASAVAADTFQQKNASFSIRQVLLPKEGQHTEYIAMLVLMGTFLYFMMSEVVVMMTTPGQHAVAGGYKILRAGLFGAVGLVAGAAFRANREDQRIANEAATAATGRANGRVNSGGTLTTATSASSSTLSMSTGSSSSTPYPAASAFSDSNDDTAMAFTNVDRQIQWCNAAFCRLAENGATNAALNASNPNSGTPQRQELLHGILLEVALNLSRENAKKLQQCFATLERNLQGATTAARPVLASEVEFILRGKIVEVRISSTSSSLDAAATVPSTATVRDTAQQQQQRSKTLLVVILKDVTEERSLQRFSSVASALQQQQQQLDEAAARRHQSHKQKEQ